MRIVQKLNLKPLEERISAMEGAGYNTFLLQNVDVFLGKQGKMLQHSVLCGLHALCDSAGAAALWLGCKHYAAVPGPWGCEQGTYAHAGFVSAACFKLLMLPITPAPQTC